MERLTENTVLQPVTTSIRYLHRAGWHIIPTCAKRDANIHFSMFLISIFFLRCCSPTRAMASSFLRLVDPTERRTTVGRSDQLRAETPT